MQDAKADCNRSRHFQVVARYAQLTILQLWQQSFELSDQLNKLRSVVVTIRRILVMLHRIGIVHSESDAVIVLFIAARGQFGRQVIASLFIHVPH